jgi:hypothetical protein
LVPSELAAFTTIYSYSISSPIADITEFMVLLVYSSRLQQRVIIEIFGFGFIFNINYISNEIVNSGSKP